MAVKIRMATTDDANGIARIYKKVWLDTYPAPENGITREDIAARNFKKRARGVKMGLEDKDNYFWVAEVEDGIVGYAKLTKKEWGGKIGLLHILPGYQGRGIGTRLMREMILAVGEGRQIRLQVSSYNKKAIAFYRKFGFKKLKKGTPLKLGNGKTIPTVKMVLAT